MTDTEIKRWRFMVSDFDDHAVYVDAEGGPNGDEQEAEFVGTSLQASLEGYRRCACGKCELAAWLRASRGRATAILTRNRNLIRCLSRNSTFFKFHRN